MNYQATVEKYSEYIAAALLAIVFLSELYTRWDYLETYDLTDVVEITNLTQMILSGLGTFILLFRNTAFQTFYNQLGSENIVKFFIAFCGLNGLLEIITCFIISTPTSRVLLEVNRKLK